VHRALPGIEVHAQLLAGLEDNDLSVRPDWSPGLELLLLALTLGAATAAVRRLAGPLAVLALLAILAVLLLGDLWALTGRGWVIPIAAPLSAGLLLGVLGIVANYLGEWHSRRSLAQLFGHYLPPERVRAMANDPERFLDVASSAENRELTVLFCDLRGFTPMSEKMAPERLRELLNLYFLRMSQIIHGHGGTLDKFIGDAVMAFWGAPQVDEQHAAHAVQAALGQLGAAAQLHGRRRRRESGGAHREHDARLRRAAAGGRQHARRRRRASGLRMGGGGRGRRQGPQPAGHAVPAAGRAGRRDAGRLPRPRGGNHGLS